MNFALTEPCSHANFLSGEFADVTANSFALWEIVFMYGRVDRIELHCSGEVETRLFESET